MKKNAGCLLLMAAVVAGCSVSGAPGHPQCKNAASTQNYGVKWQEELAEARHSGRVTIDQVMDAQGKSYSKLALLKESKWAEYCNHLDSVRKETGF